MMKDVDDILITVSSRFPITDTSKKYTHVTETQFTLI